MIHMTRCIQSLFCCIPSDFCLLMTLLQRREAKEERRNSHSTLGDFSRHLLHMLYVGYVEGVHPKRKRSRKFRLSLLHRLQRARTGSRDPQSRNRCTRMELRTQAQRLPTHMKRAAKKEAGCGREELFLSREQGTTLNEMHFWHVCTSMYARNEAHSVKSALDMCIGTLSGCMRYSSLLICVQCQERHDGAPRERVFGMIVRLLQAMHACAALREEKWSSV